MPIEDPAFKGAGERQGIAIWRIEVFIFIAKKVCVFHNLFLI